MHVQQDERVLYLLNNFSGSAHARLRRKPDHDRCEFDRFQGVLYHVAGVVLSDACRYDCINRLAC